MKPEEEIILILSRPCSSEQSHKRVRNLLERGNVDYGRFLCLASNNGVSPFIFRSLTEEDGVPGTIAEKLKAAYYGTLKRNLCHLGETLRIAGLLADAGIGAIPLKGSLAAERFFGDAGKYPTSDIDILVRPADLERARHALEADGYRNAESMSWEDLKMCTYHAVLTKSGYHIELHWNLAIRYFSIDPEFWWQETRLTVHDGREIIELAPERYLLYLIFRAFSKGFFPLKYLALAAGLVQSTGKAFEWDDFYALAEKCGMARVAAFTVSFLCHELGIDCRRPAVGERSPGYRLFRRIVLSGLFTAGRRVHLRMLLYTIFLLSPKRSLSVLLRRLFPARSEIRLRYGLAAGSNTIYLYYLMNPIFLISRNHQVLTQKVKK
jgi:hypothetical protein